MKESRRQFLGVLATAAGGALVPATRGGSQPAAPSNLRTTGRPVLTASDFQYLGAFAVPVTYQGDSGYAGGLTHRRVNGQLRLLTTYLGNHLTEFTPPVALGTGGVYPFGLAVRAWGSTFSGGLIPSGWDVTGLHWDSTDQRLYWNYISSYTTAPTSRSFAWSRLNELDGTAEVHGPYSFPSPPNYKPIKGMTAIPEGYRNRLGGMRLAAGFGGYESIITSGDGSLGPTLVPFDHSVLVEAPPNSTLPASAVRVLVNHPINGTPYTSPQRARRNPNYVQTHDGWHARDGVGYWTWGDNVAQSGIWIDTGTKQGFLVLVRQVMGGEETSFSAAAPLGENRYRLTLNAPLANVRVGDFINCPVAAGMYAEVAASVVAVEPLHLTVDMVRTQAVPEPIPKNSGRLYRGTWYYSSTGYTTAGRLAAFVYDSEELLAGKSPDTVEFSSEFAWSLPTLPAEFPSWQDAGPGTVTGITFDTDSRLLYVLVQAAWPFGSRYPNSMVYVWQVA